MKLLLPILFAGALVWTFATYPSTAAEAVTAPTPPAATPPAVTVESLQAENAMLKRQVQQLAAGIRKLQEQRDSLAQQLLNLEVQKAIETAPEDAAGPNAQQTALSPAGK